MLVRISLAGFELRLCSSVWTLRFSSGIDDSPSSLRFVVPSHWLRACAGRRAAAGDGAGQRNLARVVVVAWRPRAKCRWSPLRGSHEGMVAGVADGLTWLRSRHRPTNPWGRPWEESAFAQVNAR